MLSEFDLIFAIILVISWICGTVLNSSIVAVYLSDWKKGLNLGACDQIILTMGCTNLLMQWLLTLHLMFVSYQIYSLLANKLIFGLISFMLEFSISLSFWLTAWLTGYYCVRLVNFTNRFFIQLKRGISSVVVYCLLGTVFISFVINLPVIWTTHIITEQNLTTTIMFDNNAAVISLYATFTCFLPTIITSFGIGLSLMSLLTHVHKMKQNSSQFWNPQLKSHVKACRTMLLLLTLNLIFFLTIYIAFELREKTGTIGQHVIWYIMLSNPSLKAIILLFGNSRLANAWSKVLFSQ
ncbi:putative taste receptor type 2 member 33 [Xenopus laevis]|uniref:Taste receptor type 2 n=2 Tax=Xenopus laevis TaxID=8355 RepID=A0A974C134_XENLA|nr:putative taste receptor type 2 member 33 [Xenopus laevis]OCT64603.1 hypothetical protein XELAEV_18045702mg [Xenopus laevis]